MAGHNRAGLLTLLPGLVLISALIASGCSSSSSNTSQAQPWPKQDISGVWLGNIGETFAVGIITSEDDEHFYARFIGDGAQFISPDGSPLVQQDSAFFQGDLLECTWDTNGPSSYYSALPLRTMTVLSTAQTKAIIGPFGSYTYGPGQETGLVKLLVTFYYNNTYDALPNVENIKGPWEIENVVEGGNTLSLLITPYSGTTTGASVSGSDTKGNTFDGVITIKYSTHNVYDVNLKLNDKINLEGLATYVVNVDTNGITLPKTLAIGATDKDKTYSLSGLAKER